MRKTENPWLVGLVLLLTGFLLAVSPGVAEWRASVSRQAQAAPPDSGGVDTGEFKPIPVTTSAGTTKVLLVAPDANGSRIYLQGQLYCRNYSTTKSYDLHLWSWDGGSGTPSEIGGVIPLAASSASPPVTGIGGWCEDERGGARRTKPREGLYFSIDNNVGGVTTDVSVSGVYTVWR